MANKTKCGIVLMVFFVLGNVSTANAAYYPSSGDFYYNGVAYLDSYIRWQSPGPWSISKPAYEHDLNVHSLGYFPGTCTTFTNLPSGYDDCPTAGRMDPAGTKVFSFGSFAAKSIAKGTWYFGGWTFSAHGNVASAPFTLKGQENENRCIGLPTIWCMFSTRTRILLSGYVLNWGGYPNYVRW